MGNLFVRPRSQLVKKSSMPPLPNPIKDNQDYEESLFSPGLPLKSQLVALFGSTKFKVTAVLLALAAIGGYFLSLFLSH